MTKYKIIFIDEQKSDIDTFKDYVDLNDSQNSIEVIDSYPLETLEDMIDFIIECKADALITDFKLNDHKVNIKYNVPYNGINLVKEFLKRREGFPCFVMTTYDDDAINLSDDVNLVYIKYILHSSDLEKHAKASFLERVEKQIKHYQIKLDDAQKKILELIELRNSGKANISDENEMIKIDQFLENSIDNRNSIPEEFKKLSNTERLKELVSLVDELIKKVDGKDV